MSVRAGLKRLGDPAGTSELDWQNALGHPQAISALPDGQRLLQWRSGSFNIQSIAVVFDQTHRFVRIASRYQV